MSNIYQLADNKNMSNKYRLLQDNKPSDENMSLTKWLFDVYLMTI